MLGYNELSSTAPALNSLSGLLKTKEVRSVCRNRILIYLLGVFVTSFTTCMRAPNRKHLYFL